MKLVVTLLSLASSASGFVGSPFVSKRSISSNQRLAMAFAETQLAEAISTEEGSVELKALWEAMEKDGDGKVSGKEWGSKVYQNQDIMKKYFGGSTLSEIGQAFNKIDTDGDDQLTWEELTTQAGSYLAASNLAAAMMTDEGKAEMKALFDSLDKDGDGKVSGKEWGSKVYQNQEIMSKYFGGSSLSEIGQAFNRIDTSGDDQLTWEEFEMASTAHSYSTELQLAKAISTAEGKADLKALWDTLDTDGDGKVSGKEWGSKVYQNQDIMKKYFGGSTLSEIGQAFNKIDTDGDDQLTWEELTTQAGSYLAASNLAAAMTTDEGKAEMKALFDSLDKDSDGKVSGKEWGSKVYQNQDIMGKYFGGSTLSEIGQAFNRIDTNGDDQLTWEEFTGASTGYAVAEKIATAMRDPVAKAELKALFESLDGDSDGKVSGKEWGSKVYQNQGIMKKFFGGTTLSEIGQAFNRIDTSGDDMLSWAEFEAAY